LRGVHEIFSTMRENMNSVMAGLEDGLLLFHARCARRDDQPGGGEISGAPAGHFLGRRVTEIFPPGHPLRDALRIESDELSEWRRKPNWRPAKGRGASASACRPFKKTASAWARW